jgi:lysophospholipase L1-like esterase
VHLIRAKLPKTTIVVIGVLPRGAGGQQTPMRQAVAAVNARIARLDDSRRVRFFDCSSTFLGGDGSLNPTLYRADFLHLSSEGYRAWSESLRPKIAALLR